MVIIEQEPEMLVYHCVGHNIDDPFAIAVYKGNATRLGLGVTYYVATIVDGNIRGISSTALIQSFQK